MEYDNIGEFNSVSHKMSLSSKPKKIIPKGGCQELKVVKTVSQKGYDTLKTEEVKTLPHSLKNEPSTSQRHQPS